MSETKTFEELFLSQYEEENLKVNHLKILLINNINSNHLYLLKLKEWQMKNQEYFDYIFFLGNFLSFSENKDKNDIKEISNDEAEIGGLLSFLENLSLNIIYIGGNNDTPTIFKTPYPTLTLRSKNLHNNFHKLTEDLYIIGYGGNIVKNKFDNSLENIFSYFHEYIRENKKIDNFQIILLNNDSSYDNNNLLNNNDNEIYERVVKNKENNIFLNINGNIKTEKGTKKIKNMTIINPGSMCEGEFGILFLERDINNNNSWKIQKMNYLII